MKLLRIFGIGANCILAKDYCVQGTVTQVQRTWLHTVKKPVRLYINEQNTLFSHFITFAYTVDGVQYSGKLFVDLRFRCPQKGERIDVYCDPEKPEHYACYAFGPGAQIGW